MYSFMKSRFAEFPKSSKVRAFVPNEITPYRIFLPPYLSIIERIVSLSRLNVASGLDVATELKANARSSFGTGSKRKKIRLHYI